MTTYYVPPDRLRYRLAIARKESGLHVKQVAELTGLPEGSISAWENGVQPRNLLRVVDAYAEALDVDPEWLLRGQARCPQPPE